MIDIMLLMNDDLVRPEIARFAKESISLAKGAMKLEDDEISFVATKMVYSNDDSDIQIRINHSGDEPGELVSALFSDIGKKIFPEMKISVVLFWGRHLYC
jgi:hypothetical protein